MKTSKWSLTRKICVGVLSLVFLLIVGLALLIASEWTYIQRLRHFKWTGSRRKKTLILTWPALAALMDEQYDKTSR